MEYLSKTKLAYFSGLDSAKIRKKKGLFMAEGDKCVQDMMGSFPLVNLIATESWIENHPQFTKDTLVASESMIKKISVMSNPPDVIAIFRLPDNEWETENLPDDLYLMLDGVQDPGNLGTIIRLADWFGIYKIFASKDTVNCFNPKCVQSTMGALGRVDIIYTDLEEVIKNNKNLPVYGTLLDGEDIFTSSLSPYGFIVMGNEGQGISDKIKSLVTNPLTIPSFATKEQKSESLNVGIATAITVAEFRRRIIK